MDNFTQTEFEQEAKDARVLEPGHQGPRVYLTPQNKIIKVFRPKRRLTSNLLIPYALRFKRASERLSQLGLEAAAVELLGRCREMNLHFVVYPLLPGSSIRALNTDPEKQAKAMARLPSYLCRLHHQGVFFKGFHLGNIIWQPNSRFALIDFQSIKLRKKAISVVDREKFFRNILRYPQDYQLIKQSGIESFFDQYLQCSQLKTVQQLALLDRLAASYSYPELKPALDRLSNKLKSR